MPRKQSEPEDNDKIFSTKELHRIVADLQMDMWIGKDQDNPSVTTRLTLIEKTIASIEKIKWYFVGAIIVMIINIIKDYVHIGH